MNSRSRIFRRFGLAWAAIAAVALGGAAIAGWRATARLDARLGALRAAHEPVSLADLAPPPIPPEENAATYLALAKDEVEAIQLQVQAAVYDPLSDEEKEAFDQGRLGPQTIEKLRAILAAHPQVPGLLELAAGCPDYDVRWIVDTDAMNFTEECLPVVNAVRSATRVLGYRSAVQVADGQFDDALHTCVINLRLARHNDRIPLLNGLLVALGCRGQALRDTERVLQAGAVSQAATDELEAELARHDLSDSFRHMLRSERAVGLTVFAKLAEKLGRRAALPSFKNEECAYLDAMGRTIEGTAAPYWEWSRSDIASRYGPVGPLSKLILPALQSATVAVLRTQAELRTVRVLNVICRHEQAGDLGEPIELEQLGLPADATIDPFNGEPLHVKKPADGWAVYSVGTDLKDDGGMRQEDSDGPDVGVGLMLLTEREADQSGPAASPE